MEVCHCKYNLLAGTFSESFYTGPVFCTVAHHITHPRRPISVGILSAIYLTLFSERARCFTFLLWRLEFNWSQMPDRSCPVADRAAFRIFSPRVPYVLVSYTDLGEGHTTIICIFRETEANDGSVTLALLHEVSNPCPAISCYITRACMDTQAQRYSSHT